MSLNNKFLISLFFLSIFLFNTNTYGIFLSTELTDFIECVQDQSEEYPNLKKISLEYNPSYYGALILKCDRKLGINLNSEEAIDIYIHYALDDKICRFMKFYDGEVSKSKSCSDKFLRKAYKFLDIINNDFEIKDVVTSLYLKEFWLNNETILIQLIDTMVTDILRNNRIEYLKYVEPISKLRQKYFYM